MECKPEVFAHLVEQLCGGFVGTANQCAHLACATQQYRCLQANHLDVFVNGDVVARLEVDVVLLTLVDFHCCAVVEVHHLRHYVGRSLSNQLGCHGEHGVARKDGSVVIPLDVHRGFAAANVGFVHHIVVQKGEVVKHLKPYGRR